MVKKKQVQGPRAVENDWMAPPIQPSFSPFDFDVKPTYSQFYDMDVSMLGIHGERPYPMPNLNPHSGYLSGAKSKKSRKARKRRARMSAAKMMGIGLIALFGYAVFNYFEK